MRKATLPLITLTVGIGIGIFAHRAYELRSHRVELESALHLRTTDGPIVMTGTDGQKMVILTDTRDSLRIDPK